MAHSPAKTPWRLNRILLPLAGVALVLAVYLHDVPHNPPGFFIDEASIAYNAYTISQTGADEYGQRWPLYFRAFGEYKSPLYIYVLGAVFWFTGPSTLAARMLSAVASFVAAVVLGLLALRITQRRTTGVVVFLTAVLTPWLFEISRLVFEVSLFPVVLAFFLLLLHTASRREEWSWPVAVGLGGLLALMVYTYSIGRLLAPCFALGLGFFITRRRWRGVVLTCFVFGLTLLPLASFTFRNPRALGERFKYVTYIKPEDTRAQIALRFARNYVLNLSPRSWLLFGDPEPRHHLPGMGSLLLGMVILALLGLILVVLRQRSDPWWRFVVWGLAASPIPASLTLDHFHTLRLIALPVFLLVLTIPAIEFLLAQSGARPKVRHAVLAVLVLMILVQGTVFQWRFHTASDRADAFDSYYPEVLDAALMRNQRPIYLFDKTPAAYMYAFWYATLRGVRLYNFHHVQQGETPPAGALVISHEMPCPNCEMILQRGQFKVYVQK